LNDLDKSNTNFLKKTTSNAISGIFFFIINTIISLILNPILVNYLGSSYFGMWKSIDHFLGFASIADGKGSQALKWTIANQESSEDFNKKQREVGSAIVVWFVFLPILLIIIGILTYFSPSLINGIDESEYDLIRLIVLLLGLNLIITPLLGVSESVLVGVNKGYIPNYVKAFWLVISAISMYGVLYLGFSIKELAIVTIIITIARGTHYFFSCRQKVSWFGVKRPRKNELITFFKFSSWKLVWSFVARFLMSSEIIFLSILVSASSVSQYIFTGYISIVGISLAAIVSSAITPGLGRLIGNGELEKSRKIIKQLRELLLATSLFIASGMLLLNKSFVFLWVGEELFLGDVNNILIALLMIQIIVIRNEAFLIDLSLNIKTKVMVGLASVALSVIFSVVGYQYIYNDISSIFIGIFLGRLVMLFIFPYLTNNMIQLSNISSINFKLLFTIIIFLSVIISIGYYQVLDTWISLFFVGFLEILIALITLYFFILSNDNQLLIKNRLTVVKGKLWR
jgi:O-antigen/teichoic acid export membrane protein